MNVLRRWNISLIFALFAGAIMFFASDFRALGAAPSADASEPLSCRPEPRDNDWWVKRFEKNRERIDRGGVDLLLLGDSIVESLDGDGQRVQEYYYGDRNAVNMGFGGDRTEHLLWRLDHLPMDKIAPRAAVLMIGSNNLYGPEPDEAIALGVRRCVDRLRSLYPAMPILLLGVTPEGERPDEGVNVRIANLNRLIREATSDVANLVYREVGSLWCDENGWATLKMTRDHCHPNAAGCQAWLADIEPVISEWLGVPAKKPPFENMFVINEDNSHFFASRTPDQMTVDGLNAFVDQYADTKVTHLFLNPNASRANFSNSARSAIWEPNSEGIEPTDRWPQNGKLLEEKGLDPYKIWIERSREKKISPWISMRMNDLHEVGDVTNFMHSSFWVNHPELWRVPNDTTKNWVSRALNFKHEAVRKHATDFLAVLFERYDFDGIELDWMRFGYHLTPGHEAEEAHCLTEVMRFARSLADEYSVKRGHVIYVAARVPATPEAAAGLGMDGVAWAKERLVDLLIPCPFWTTSDFDIPVERWNERLDGTGVAVAPGMEYNVRAYPSAHAHGATVPELYGFAASEKFRGTTNIYLFNWMDCDTLPVAQNLYREILKNGFGDEFLSPAMREVPVTYHDTVPDGCDANIQLPKETNTPAAFKLPLGPKPLTDAGNGVLIALEQRDGLAAAQFSAALNGVEARKISDDSYGSPDAARGLVFEFPLQAFRDGYNEFVVTQTAGEPQKIVFVTARINAPSN